MEVDERKMEVEVVEKRKMEVEVLEERTLEVEVRKVEVERKVLPSKYGENLQKMEEFAVQYMSEEFNHPVISCFRELTKSDVLQITGSGKLKKSLTNLERSVLYLGLLDFLATTNNNPFYGDNCNAKLSKNISGSVQKILLEFKNIIGTWALSGNEELLGRYSLIMNYFRTIVPMFQKVGFDKEFSDIVDCIEREVARHKTNQEKVKSFNNSENVIEKKQVSEDSLDESRSALNEIILNVSLNIKDDDSDDEEVGVEEKIFGKPIRPSPKSTTSVKRTNKTNPSRMLMESGGGCKPGIPLQQNIKIKTSTTDVIIRKSTPPQPRPVVSALAPSNLASSNSVNTNGSIKRSANEELKPTDSTKKLKLGESGIPVTTNSNNRKEKDIRILFQSCNSVNPTKASNTSSTSPAAVPKAKPIVNAFALMMNRSRELSQQKKENKLNSPQVSALKVRAVKS